MDNPQNLERIERYLRNEMEAAERSGFEKELADDQELAAAFTFHQELHQHLSDSHRPEVEAAALQARENYIANTTRKSITRYLYPSIGAVAAILVILFFLFAPDTSQQDYQAIAMEYAKPYPASVFRSEGGSDYSTAFAAGMDAYRAENYEQAAMLLNSLPENDLSYPEARFYLGVTQLMLGQYASANSILDEYLLLADGRNEDEARWYKSLSLLGMGRAEEARTILNDLLKYSKGKIKTQATQLLETLD